MGLFDMVMIKDNHISIAGGITSALKSVDLYLEKNNLQMGVEVVHYVLALLKLEFMNYPYISFGLHSLVGSVLNIEHVGIHSRPPIQ